MKICNFTVFSSVIQSDFIPITLRFTGRSSTTTSISRASVQSTTATSLALAGRSFRCSFRPIWRSTSTTPNSSFGLTADWRDTTTWRPFNDSADSSAERMHLGVRVEIGVDQRVLTFSVELNFFAPHHGHSVCDGHFGSGKRALRNAIGSGVIIDPYDVTSAFRGLKDTTLIELKKIPSFSAGPKGDGMSAHIVSSFSWQGFGNTSRCAASQLPTLLNVSRKQEVPQRIPTYWTRARLRLSNTKWSSFGEKVEQLCPSSQPRQWQCWKLRWETRLWKNTIRINLLNPIPEFVAQWINELGEENCFTLLAADSFHLFYLMWIQWTISRM